MKDRPAQLRDFYGKYHRLPSYSEMMQLFKVKSKNTVHHIVKKFEEEGLVKRDSRGQLIPGKLRGKVKLLGKVSAGFPSPAEEELVDMISLDDFLINRKDATFMLEVSGDSMILAGIEPGDMVLVERGKDPQHGDIIVAAVDGEWTVKRYMKKGGEVFLKPENPKYPIINAKEKIELGGTVVSVIRKYH